MVVYSEYPSLTCMLMMRDRVYATYSIVKDLIKCYAGQVGKEIPDRFISGSSLLAVIRLYSGGNKHP